jgi:DNA-directed RNA polymerases I, II, and III subunit RPABC3
MLLEDLFDVKNIDEDGKKFDNISRISALSQTYNLELTLDVNTEIYPIKVRWIGVPRFPPSCSRACAGV